MNKIDQTYRNFIYAGITLLAVVSISTIGYHIIADGKSTWVDSLFMTIITIASIGYGEITKNADTQTGRVFTIFVAVFGIAVLTYIITNVTAFIVEGQLREVFKRKRMQKQINEMSGHYIVCGVDGVGRHIIGEMVSTHRSVVMLDIKLEHLEKESERMGIPFLEGDATDESMLKLAGLDRAAGIYASTGDDNVNLVIILTAKQLNPNIRAVCCCHDLKNVEKTKRAGADAVVSPTFIGGMRMASEMVRPAVVSFLDIMLRDKQKNLRIEEVAVPEHFAGKTVEALDLKNHPHTLLLSIKHESDWVYNPSYDYPIQKGDTLVFMTTPDARFALEEIMLG